MGRPFGVRCADSVSSYRSLLTLRGDVYDPRPTPDLLAVAVTVNSPKRLLDRFGRKKNTKGELAVGLQAVLVGIRHQGGSGSEVHNLSVPCTGRLRVCLQGTGVAFRSTISCPYAGWCITFILCGWLTICAEGWKGEQDVRVRDASSRYGERGFR